MGIDERPGKEKTKKSKKSSSSSAKKRRKDQAADDSDDDDDDDDEAVRRALRKDRMVPSHPITDVSPFIAHLICSYDAVTSYH